MTFVNYDVIYPPRRLKILIVDLILGGKRTGRNYIMCKEGLLLYDIILIRFTY